MVQVIGLMVGGYILMRAVDMYTRLALDGKTPIHSDKARRLALLVGIGAVLGMVLLVLGGARVGAT